MRRLVFALSVIAGIAGILAAATPVLDAGSCNGRGKAGEGRPPVWCRNCVVPEGCQLIECSKCGCDVLCPEGSFRTYPVVTPIGRK